MHYPFLLLARRTPAVLKSFSGDSPKTRPVLIDLGATARVHEIAETESLLTSGFRRVPVVCMTQYDGRRLPEAIPVSQLRRHGLVIFRDFYALPVSHRAALDENSVGQNRKRPTSEDGLYEYMVLVNGK